MRRRLLVAAAVVVVAVIGVVAWLVWPRGTTEVSKKEALERFRERGTSTAKTPVESTPRAPASGVYTYDATGTETVKLGPLPAETRPLPATVTAAVRDEGSGCFEWSVNLFAEHTEDTRWCVEGTSLRLDRHVKHQKIGALSPTATMTCDPAVFVTDLAAPGRTDVRCTLQLSGGPIAVKADLAGTATWGEAEQRTIGGTRLSVRPLTVHYPVTGSESGVWDETTWFDEQLLPVEVERSFHLSGPANFDETSTLTLQSTSPET